MDAGHAFAPFIEALGGSTKPMVDAACKGLLVTSILGNTLPAQNTGPKTKTGEAAATPRVDEETGEDKFATVTVFRVESRSINDEPKSPGQYNNLRIMITENGEVIFIRQNRTMLHIAVDDPEFAKSYLVKKLNIENVVEPVIKAVRIDK